MAAFDQTASVPAHDRLHGSLRQSSLDDVPVCKTVMFTNYNQALFSKQCRQRAAHSASSADNKQSHSRYVRLQG